MDAIALSKNGIPIRFPEERWEHILQRHQDLASIQSEVLATVSNPARILAGDEGEFLVDDEFIITAYPTRRLSSLNRRQQLWP